MASGAGDPAKDKLLKDTTNEYCKVVNRNLLMNASHKVLRHVHRDLMKKLADVEFYRDIRTRQD